MTFSAVTILSSPKQWEPINTDGLWFQMDSQDYTLQSYNYIADLYSYNMDFPNPPGPEFLGSYKIPPRPFSGNGIFTPHKILKSKVANTFLSPISITSSVNTFDGMTQYWINYGFIVDPNLQYYDFEYVGSTFSLVATQPLGLQVGDIIYVSKNNQKVNITYEGYTTVTQVISATQYATDVVYNSSTPPGTDGGYITSLQRVNQSTFYPFTSELCTITWNSVRQYTEKYKSFDNYVVNNVYDSSFLTEYYNEPTGIPNNMIPIRKDQWEVASYIASPGVMPIYGGLYVGYPENSNTFVELGYSTFSSFVEKGKKDVGIGPMNIMGAMPAVTFNNVGWYKYLLIGPYSVIGQHINNGYFTSPTASWITSSTGSNVSTIIGNGVCTFTGPDIFTVGQGQVYQLGVLQIGQTYVVGFDIVDLQGAAVVGFNYGSTQVSSGMTGIGRYTSNPFVATDTSFGIIFAGIGPGTSSVVIDNVIVYDTSILEPVCEIARRIDNTCSVYNNIQLRYLNRAGGFECYNFTRYNQKTMTTTKTEWRQELPWNYVVGDRQQSVLSQRAEYTYVANTDWVSEYDYNHLQQIISSPEVFMVQGTYSIPIVITDSVWSSKTRVTDQVFNLKIAFKEAQNVTTQDN